MLPRMVAISTPRASGGAFHFSSGGLTTTTNLLFLPNLPRAPGAPPASVVGLAGSSASAAVARRIVPSIMHSLIIGQYPLLETRRLAEAIKGSRGPSSSTVRPGRSVCAARGDAGAPGGSARTRRPAARRGSPTGRAAGGSSCRPPPAPAPPPRPPPPSPPPPPRPPPPPTLPPP